MLKLTPPGTLDKGTGALYNRATVYFGVLYVLSPLFKIHLRLIQNPGELSVLSLLFEILLNVTEPCSDPFYSKFPLSVAELAYSTTEN